MKCLLFLRVHTLCTLAACLTHCTTQKNADQLNQMRYGQLIVPASFSPDHDGYHDAWQIENLKAGADISVYTFFGELVYRSQAEYVPWDGTYKKKDVPAGNYFYVINIGKGLSNPAGWVTIKR